MIIVALLYIIIYYHILSYIIIYYYILLYIIIYYFILLYIIIQYYTNSVEQYSVCYIDRTTTSFPPNKPCFFSGWQDVTKRCFVSRCFTYQIGHTINPWEFRSSLLIGAVPFVECYHCGPPHVDKRGVVSLGISSRFTYLHVPSRKARRSRWGSSWQSC